MAGKYAVCDSVECAQELDDAIECFSKAQDLDSSDPAIGRELAKAKQARTAAEKKQRATYSKMFG